MMEGMACAEGQGVGRQRRGGNAQCARIDVTAQADDDQQRVGRTPCLGGLVESAAASPRPRAWTFETLGLGVRANGRYGR